jgi:hypothetical protein
MIKRAIVADLRSFADHYAHAVIDENASSYGCARMNLYTCEPAPEMGNQARNPLEFGLPQPVCKAVIEQRVETRVTGNHLPGIACRGVTLENNRYAFLDTGKHIKSVRKQWIREAKHTMPQ